MIDNTGRASEWQVYGSSSKPAFSVKIPGLGGDNDNGDTSIHKTVCAQGVHGASGVGIVWMGVLLAALATARPLGRARA
ncbi:MAG: hypothetical protein HYY16_02510 [Planctomycetes bacterium]|nr:hypothetical protein [Planctomycetota bacterium]